MPCVTYSCPPITDHEVNICGDVVKGGQDGFLLFTCDADLADPTLDIQDTAAVDVAVAADIAAGKAVYAQEINFTQDAGSPVQFGTQTVAARPNAQITTDYTATVIDANVNVQNDDFYEATASTSGRVWGGFIVKHAQTPAKAHFVLPDNGLYIQVTKALPADTDPVHYSATFTYKKVGLPRVIPAPTLFTT
jgi:hypothetical protein